MIGQERKKEKERIQMRRSIREKGKIPRRSNLYYFSSHEIKEKIRKEEKEGKKSRGKERMLTTQDAYNMYAHSELFFETNVMLLFLVYFYFGARVVWWERARWTFSPPREPS